MFVWAVSISESIEKYTRIIKELDEIKLIPRAGITCCFLNGRGFKGIHEVGISLLYVYILLTIQSVPLKNTAITVMLSFFFTVCMQLALQTRKNRLSLLLCSIFCVLDIFITVDMAAVQCISHVFGVQTFSLGILLVMYIDGRTRPGIKQCIVKDISVLVYFLIKKYDSRLCIYYPHSVSAIIIIWSVIEAIRTKKTPLLPGVIEDDISTESEESERTKRPRRKASLRLSEKNNELPAKSVSSKEAQKPKDKKAKTSKKESSVTEDKPKKSADKPKKSSEKSVTKSSVKKPAEKSAARPVVEETAQKTKPVRAAAKEARSKSTKK
ncbi:hypothetical protein NEPAR06_0623 [Nematocida parisii]|uniref:Uncharacterized protein n=1 Tax=Nematocida parisii (strain ERTm3) TaxID=935791 RepID=I3EEW4_NEMP3|nr:uncharacterized protein NEPG_01942 [Nematocida parisii ERTm1]EIJ87761.1 hypothetical protein NEQG_01833 [Nematocida parisii ERTm3]KAI5127209.1 hypothetical protein NEPAR08_0806 [Nematocida parisii]EIJ92987.1 hypothetical protein NEPG_01942 [Nematocida parisii ERTm1]KAI5127294.1 hypothetical protein NEPAR03_0898 [Nematocida parisii]KAI5141402.1 hypothetical protein NEPAR04_0955 [Nematocida parisii]|eukprot:XP_013059770.1 hypothetical protein NEPG_01942 [Nematocida parisii ERTm1]